MDDVELSTMIDVHLAEQALALSKKRLLWVQHKALLTPIIKELTHQGIEPNFTGDDIILSFTGDALKLRHAMEVLVAAHFTTTADKPKPGDTMWYAFFSHSACRIKLFVNFSSSVCIRKKIGTKLVEQDVYETICGDCTTDSLQLPALAPILNHDALPW